MSALSSRSLPKAASRDCLLRLLSLMIWIAWVETSVTHFSAAGSAFAARAGVPATATTPKSASAKASGANGDRLRLSIIMACLLQTKIESRI
jgi:hypothetical protein